MKKIGGFVGVFLSLLVVGLLGKTSEAAEILVYETDFALGPGEVDYNNPLSSEDLTKSYLSYDSTDRELNTIGTYWKNDLGFSLFPYNSEISYFDNGYKLYLGQHFNGITVTDKLTYDFQYLKNKSVNGGYFGINFKNEQGQELFKSNKKYNFVIEGKTRRIDSKVDLNTFEFSKWDNGGFTVNEIANKTINGEFKYSFEYIRNFDRPRDQWGTPFPPTIFFGAHIVEEQDENYGSVELNRMKIYEIDSETKVLGISIAPENYTIKTGKSKLLYSKIEPDTATNKKVTYKSSDLSTVKVFSNGKVQGIKPGVATVTATTDDGGFTAESIITVE